MDRFTLGEESRDGLIASLHAFVPSVVANPILFRPLLFHLDVVGQRFSRSHGYPPSLELNGSSLPFADFCEELRDCKTQFETDPHFRVDSSSDLSFFLRYVMISCDPSLRYVHGKYLSSLRDCFGLNTQFSYGYSLGKQVTDFLEGDPVCPGFLCLQRYVEHLQLE